MIDGLVFLPIYRVLRHHVIGKIPLQAFKFMFS